MKAILVLIPVLMLSACTSKLRKKAARPAPVCYRNYDQFEDKKSHSVSYPEGIHFFPDGSGFENDDIPTGRASLKRLDFLEFLLLNEEFDFKDPKISHEDYLKILSAHEFGHVAGLLYEHMRSEACGDPNCKSPGFEMPEEARFYSMVSNVSTSTMNSR